MTDTVVRARVSSASKVAAMMNAKLLGIDLSTAIRLLVNHLAASAELPKDLLQPNQETLKAIRDLESGIKVHKVDTIDQLKRDLGW